jgi:hypothetical protein
VHSRIQCVGVRDAYKRGQSTNFYPPQQVPNEYKYSRHRKFKAEIVVDHVSILSRSPVLQKEKCLIVYSHLILISLLFTWTNNVVKKIRVPLYSLLSHTLLVYVDKGGIRKCLSI